MFGDTHSVPLMFWALPSPLLKVPTAYLEEARNVLRSICSVYDEYRQRCMEGTCIAFGKYFQRVSGNSCSVFQRSSQRVFGSRRPPKRFPWIPTVSFEVVRNKVLGLVSSEKHIRFQVWL